MDAVNGQGNKREFRQASKPGTVSPGYTYVLSAFGVVNSRRISDGAVRSARRRADGQTDSGVSWGDPRVACVMRGY